MLKPNYILALIAIAAVVGCSPSVTEEDEAKLATAEQMFEAWNTLDWQLAFDLFSEDGVLQSMMSEPIVGREVIRARLADLVGNIDRIELQIRNIGVVNDVVMFERVDDFVYKGKHSRVPVVGVMEIANGEVLEWREYYDKAMLTNALITTEDDKAGDSPDAEGEVRAVLKSLQEDWNRGDMQAYLDAYWDDEGLTLVFGDQVISGKSNMTRMFTTGWPDEEKMGDFATANEAVTLLGRDTAGTKGTFQHQFTDELVVGAFTHVLQRMGDGEWRIVHEHTSRKNPES